MFNTTLTTEKIITIKNQEKGAITERIIKECWWVHENIWKKFFRRIKSRKYSNERILIKNKESQNKEGPENEFSRISPEELDRNKILMVGDEIRITFPNDLEPKTNNDYEILFEDDHFIITNKPPHLPVTPGGRYYHNSLKYQLWKDQNRIVEPCHRLDKESSGIVVFAKNPESARAFGKLLDHKRALLRDRDHLLSLLRTERAPIIKEYWTIVHDSPLLSSLTSDERFSNTLTTRPESARDPENKLCKGSSAESKEPTNINENNEGVSFNKGFIIIDRPLSIGEGVLVKKRSFIDFNNGRRSTTLISGYLPFKIADKRLALLRIILLTGRFHQIRAHLSSIGSPIVGDKIYIDEEEFINYLSEEDPLNNQEYLSRLISELGSTHQLLHARRLSFEHPFTKERVVIRAALPAEFKNLLIIAQQSIPDEKKVFFEELF